MHQQQQQIINIIVIFNQQFCLILVKYLLNHFCESEKSTETYPKDTADEMTYLLILLFATQLYHLFDCLWMKCSFEEPASYRCIDKDCSENKLICSNSICQCLIPHWECQMIKKDRMKNRQQSLQNPQDFQDDSFQIYDIKMLKLERVKKLTAPGNLIFQKKNNMKSTHQKNFQTQMTLQQLIDRVQIEHGKGKNFSIKKNNNQLNLNSSSNQSVHYLLNNKEERKFKWPDSFLKQCFRQILLDQKPTLVVYKGITYDYLPSEIDYSQITVLHLQTFNKRLTHYFIKYLTNLSRLDISRLQFQMINSKIKRPLDFLTIVQLSRITTLKKLNFKQISDLNGPEMVKYALMFPQNKRLKLYSCCSNKLVLMQILHKKHNLEQIEVVNKKKGFKTKNQIVVDATALNLLFQTSPNLKTFQYQQCSQIDQSSFSSLIHFEQLQTLQLRRQNCDFQFQILIRETKLNIKKPDQRIQPIISILSNMRGLKNIDLSIIQISISDLNHIYSTCPQLQKFKFEAYQETDANFFKLLSKFKDLYFLHMSIYGISKQEWEVLAKAQFQLKHFCFIQLNRMQRKSRFDITIPRAVMSLQSYLEQLNHSINSQHPKVPFLFDKVGIEFLENQLQINYFLTTLNVDNDLCMALHNLKSLQKLGFCMTENCYQKDCLTGSGYLYLSKLKELKQFKYFHNSEENKQMYFNRPFFRLLMNNRKLRKVPTNNLCPKMLRNLSLRQIELSPPFSIKAKKISTNVFTYGEYY